MNPADSPFPSSGAAGAKPQDGAVSYTAEETKKMAQDAVDKAKDTMK